MHFLMILRHRKVDEDLAISVNESAAARLYSKSWHVRPHGTPPVTLGSLAMLGGVVASGALIAAAVFSLRQRAATTNYDETELLETDTENQVE